MISRRTHTVFHIGQRWRRAYRCYLGHTIHAKHVIFSGVPFANKKWMAAAARIERGTSGDHAAAAAAALRRKRPRERNDGMAAMAAQRQNQKEREREAGTP